MTVTGLFPSYSNSRLSISTPTLVNSIFHLFVFLDDTRSKSVASKARARRGRRAEGVHSYVHDRLRAGPQQRPSERSSFYAGRRGISVAVPLALEVSVNLRSGMISRSLASMASR